MSLWTQAFGPKTPQELSINKNKIIEVKNFLDGSFIRSDSGHNSRKPILVIFGQNGIGKTTILRCLCNNKIKIIEWEPTTLSEGLGASFYRFIFNSIFFSKTSLNEKVLVLIKDLPITLLQHNSQVLIEIRHFLSKIVLDSFTTIPIVFITGEDRNERQFLKFLLPGELDIFNESCTDKKFARYIKVVRLNPVPSTIIKSKLKSILNVKKISIGRVEENIIEKIVQTSNGDLCHAVSQLQFFFEGGQEVSNRSGGINSLSFDPELFFSVKKRRNCLDNHDQSTQSSDIVFGKEPMYNLFRTIGKVLYNKREECIKKSKLEHLHNTYSKRTKMNSKCSDIYNNRLKFLGEIDMQQKPHIYYYCEGFKDIFDCFFNIQASQDPLKGKLSFDVEDLLIYSGIEDNSLILLLQENYIPFIGNSIDTIICSNIFSWSDVHTNYLDSDYFSSILASCIARTILYFNSKPLNPCSPDYQTHDDLKVGFSKNQFSLWKKQENLQKKTLESDNSIEKPKKTMFKWHPKKPAFKAFISSLEALKEDCKNFINKCLPFHNETNGKYLLFSKAIFTEVFPYLKYLLIATNYSFTLNNTINSELTKFINSWSKYNKNINLSQLNLNGSTSVVLGSDQILYCHDNSSNTYCCEYLSDEQLVSILETCDIENLQGNSVVNSFFESISSSNNDALNSIDSSDDSVDDNSE